MSRINVARELLNSSWLPSFASRTRQRAAMQNQLGTSRPTAALVRLATFGLMTVAALPGCDDNDASECVPGETRLCAGVGRCSGVQSCEADGSGFEQECDCSVEPADISGGDDLDTALTPLVARACTEDSQCGEGLECLTSDANVDPYGGGMPNGYCSKPCQETAECASVDSLSECVEGHCVRICASRSPASEAENKCLGRPDIACKSEAALGINEPGFDRQRGWCLPQCNSNEDCPGRICNIATGVCTDTAPEGAAIGEKCDENGECASNLCLAISADGADRLCSAPCRFSIPIAPTGCGYGLSATVREASCLGPQVQSIFGNEGSGDLGFCLELCDQDSDCAQSSDGWACSLAEGFEARTGRAGVCFRPNTPEDAGAVGDASPAPDSGPLGVDASSAPDAQN